MQRRTIAIGILSVWAGALALLAWKEFRPDEGKRRVFLSLLVEPISYYYAIERNGEHIGYATSQVDTSLFGLELRHTLVTRSPADGINNRASSSFNAALTQQLGIRNLSSSVRTTADPVLFYGRTIGDSALEVRHQAGTRGPADTVPFSRYTVTPEIAPFLIALDRDLKVGDVIELQLFDRATSRASNTPIRVEAESLFVVSDSARRDSVSGYFVSAREDTVRAWRAMIPAEGGGMVWFDRGGRIVLQDLGNGSWMRRTAFNIAFDNWRDCVARDERATCKILQDSR